MVAGARFGSCRVCEDEMSQRMSSRMRDESLHHLHAKPDQGLARAKRVAIATLGLNTAAPCICSINTHQSKFGSGRLNNSGSFYEKPCMWR
jgi:hypothetical protein